MSPTAGPKPGREGQGICVCCDEGEGAVGEAVGAGNLQVSLETRGKEGGLCHLCWADFAGFELLFVPLLC